MSTVEFDDLPQVGDEDEMRRVHTTTGLYFLSKTLVAHADLDCYLAVGDDPAKLVRNTRWRVANDAQVRALGGSWCTACCS